MDSRTDGKERYNGNKTKKDKGQYQTWNSHAQRPMQLSLHGMKRAEQHLYKHTTGLTGKVQSIAMALALPLNYPPVRVASIYSSAATSVAKPYYIRSCNWSVPTGEVVPIIPKTSMFVALSRNPMRALIQYTPNPTNQYYEADVYFTNANNSPGLSNQLNIPACVGFEFPVPMIYSTDKYVGNASYFHPHGPKVYAGTHDGRRGMWVDGHDTLAATKGKFICTCTTTCKVDLFILGGAAWVLVRTVSLLASTPTDIDCLVPGYYSLSVADAAAACAFYAVIRTASASFGHWAVPYMESKESAIGMIRTTSASLMLSCASSPDRAEGIVCGVQLKPGFSWLDIIGPSGSDPCTEIMRTTGGDSAVEMRLETGIYAYHRPMSEHALVEQTPIRFNQTGMVDMQYPLVEMDGWLCIGATTVLNSGSYPGGDCYVTAVWGVEFSSPDPWYSSLVPSSTPEDFEHAIRALRNLEQWHENPFHLSDVKNFLKSAGRKALKISPKFLKALGFILPEFSPITTILENAASALNHAID